MAPNPSFFQSDTPFVTLLVSSSGAKTAFEVDSSTELAPIHSIVKKGDPRFLREVIKAVEGAADYQVTINNAKSSVSQ